MTPKNPSRRAVWSWVFYDWANSAFSTTVMAGFFPVFFKTFLSKGVDVNLSTAKLGFGNFLGTLFIAVTAPVLGALSDMSRLKKPFLFLFAALGALATISLAFLGEGQWALAVFIYVVASLTHASSLAFYDALLPQVSQSKNVHRISSLGFSAGYLGGGLLFAVNILMYSKPEWFGFADGVAAVRASFITVGIWWLLFTLPLMLWVPEGEPSGGRINWISAIAQMGSELRKTLGKVSRNRSLVLFLIAFFLYNDGVGTTIRMAVDYGLSIGFKAGDLIAALLLVQFVGVPSSLVFGRIATHFRPKTAIAVGILVYLVSIVWAYRMQEPWEFFSLAVLIGLVQGGVQAISRSFFTELIPEDQAGEYFGVYNLLGRFGGVLGPLLMAWVNWGLGSSRMGILSIALLFLLGLGLLQGVTSPKHPASM